MLATFLGCIKKEEKQPLALDDQQRQIAENAIGQWLQDSDNASVTDRNPATHCQCQYEIIDFSYRRAGQKGPNLTEFDLHQTDLYALPDCNGNPFCKLFRACLSNFSGCQSVPNPTCVDFFINPQFNPIPFQDFNCLVPVGSTFPVTASSYIVNPSTCDGAEASFSITFRLKCKLDITPTSCLEETSPPITIERSAGSLLINQTIQMGGDCGCKPTPL